MMHIEDLIEVGQGLNRPECVLAHKSGLIFTSNWSTPGGISIINPSSHTTNFLGQDPLLAIKPNGIALESNGSFLLAHLGASDGGIFRLSPTGSVSSAITHANGLKLPPSNYVTVDSIGRIWITVSTTQQPRSSDYRASANTGFIAVADPGVSDARIVADKLGYANECIVDMEQSAVYVNETFARQLSRFDLADDGSLSNRHTIAHFPTGTYPDGVALDEEGNLWITSIVSNRIIKVTPDGEQTLVLEDADDQFVNNAEAAYLDNSMSSKHLSSTGNTSLANTSSLAFGGSELSVAYIGNLLGDRIHQFEPGVSGRAPTHWDVPLGHLAEYLA